ncbi:uvrD-like Helicase, ATP-binding domain, P-loop containing nucleoside triphosphate hydrolase [Artemisia annua]|uniref:UvrD-like Helicase, ATP-binding domain, P-loop containing nucleoside triphosphate hydrolase n=1 Tax=Artemisia annua TaxID=35608 RepID=A0A2U1KC17_ARTAN|nr:uvrD-like Helicase, ATP-binding domain, P-loop containing nucleoside triphosphate hydrolase [Artemisia annua]
MYSVNGNTVYLLVNKDAECHGRELVFAIRSYWQLELVSGCKALYEHIIKKLHWNPKWKSFVEKFRDNGLRELLILQPFSCALKDTFAANSMLAGYISPDSFVHLLDRLLFMNSLFCRTFYSSKSSFVGWFTYLHSPATPTKRRYYIMVTKIGYQALLLSSSFINEVSYDAVFDSSRRVRLLAAGAFALFNLIFKFPGS